MKGKQNRRKRLVFLIMILVGFVYLHFNGFSYPGNMKIMADDIFWTKDISDYYA